MILKDYNLDELQYVTKVCNELCVNYNWLLSAYVLVINCILIPEERPLSFKLF